MNKRMRELQNLIQTKSAEAVSFTDGEHKDISKAQALLDEVEGYEKELNVLSKLEQREKASVPSGGGAGGVSDVLKKFATAIKNLKEGTGADGGYTVPEDINTRINELREEEFSLKSLIDYEVVNAPSGRRTYKKRAQRTGFQQVGEGGKIPKSSKPTFSIIKYAIKKFAGYLPVTNELLEDSDQAIAETMTDWLAKESTATENAQIVIAIKEKEATPLTGLKDIKKAVNVTLANFKGTVHILTNNDGLQYLDTLEDKNGRPLLSPDPQNPMNLFLCVGVQRVPLDIAPNDVLPTSETGAIPFVIGDMFQYMKEFDKKQLSLTISNTAAVTDFNAFEQDMTLIRAIMRADFVVKDEDAIVYGELTPAA